MPGLISLSDYFSSGIVDVNLRLGEARNFDPSKAIQGVIFDGLKKFNMGNAKSIAIFCDAPVTLEIGNGKLENDQSAYWRTLRPLDLETIRITSKIAFVPDKYKVIIIASDDPNFEYRPAKASPYISYSHALTAIAASYQDILFRRTVFENLKALIQNTGAENINLDIQHANALNEDGTIDTNDAWKSYSGYPTVLNAGDSLIWGNSQQYLYHRVRVQSVANTSTVKASMYGV